MPDQKNVCCSAAVKTLILACSGGSNVGQISNAVMIELDKMGVGNAYCLAGIGSALPGFVETAKVAKTIVIDGCQVGCGKKMLEKHGITPSHYFIVTELGIIDKAHDFSNLDREAEMAFGAIASSI